MPSFIVLVETLSNIEHIAFTYDAQGRLAIERFYEVGDTPEDAGLLAVSAHHMLSAQETSVACRRTRPCLASMMRGSPERSRAPPRHAGSAHIAQWIRPML